MNGDAVLHHDFGNRLHPRLRISDRSLPLHQTMDGLCIGPQAMLRISFADRSQHLIDFGMFAQVRGDFGFDPIHRLGLLAPQPGTAYEPP